MAKKKKARGGAAIQTVEEPTSAPQPAAEEKKARERKKICPGCGAGLAFATRRCPECGHPFGKQAEAKKGARGRVAEKKAGPSGDPVSLVLAASEFASQVGGIDQAISLLEALKQIKG